MIKVLILLFALPFQSFAKTPLTKILVIYDSTHDETAQLASAVADGARNEVSIEVSLKSIDQVKPQRLADYDGLAFGSPIYFGSMSSKMKSFLDKTLPLWEEQKLAGKPASVFMSAGSGLGKESAILSIWSVLASHGMIMIPNGPLGMKNSDKSIPHGFTPYGITSLSGLRADKSISKDELKTAQLQGQILAKTARALKNFRNTTIELPEAPKAVGNYQTYRISGKNIYINQIALKNGNVLYPGKIGKNVTIEEAKIASHQTALNIISVLKDAVDGDLSKIKSAVQLSGYFNTSQDFEKHSLLMDEVSKVMIEFFGEKGKHARAAMGSSSLPLNSPVEVQAIFEMK